MSQRFLILSASMGAGHDAVAHELAHRLRRRGHTAGVHDILELLPAGAGRALRAGYRAMVRRVPGVYGRVYASFLASSGSLCPGSGPVAALAESPLAELVAGRRPDAVVSTFHLAAQVTGRMRERGTLGVPSAVTVLDFAVHHGWLHPGNDLYLCVTGEAARTVREATDCPVKVTGPTVPARFFGAVPGRWGPLLARHAGDRPTVLLSAGAWGVGSRLPGTARELAGHGFLPVVLCGRDERLHLRSRLPGVLPLDWVEDMPELLAAADALVDNAAGQTAVQALAGGVPVVGHLPVPGHGKDGVEAMAAAGIGEYAHGTVQLLDVLGRLTASGSPRQHRIEAGRAAFRSDAAQHLVRLARPGERRG